MPIRIDLTHEASESEASWFDYDDAPEGESLKLLIIPLTPLIDEQLTEKCTVMPANVNGRFRRQTPTIRFRQGLYKRLVFQACVKDWSYDDGLVPLLQDQHGKPIACSEETKAFVSEKFGGILDFGFDIATALGQISAEQVKDERAKFRGVVEIQNRPPQSGLHDVRETD